MRTYLLSAGSDIDVGEKMATPLYTTALWLDLQEEDEEWEEDEELDDDEEWEEDEELDDDEWDEE